MLKVLKKDFFFSYFFISIISLMSLFAIFNELQFKSSEASTNGVAIENLIYLKLKNGVVVIQLFPEVAPKTVSRIKELTRAGFYNNNLFFRVIEGFVAQVGDPTGTGRGGSGKTLNAEFSNVSHKRGIVSMARANDVNSADSQFFIVLKDSEFLDTKYTVFGKVISGMEFVDDIKKSKTGSSGIVTDPDKIYSMALAIDVDKSMKEEIKKSKKAEIGSIKDRENN